MKSFEEKAAYLKKWRADHPPDAAERRRRLEYNQKWRKDNAAYYAAYRAEYQHKNRFMLAAKAKANYHRRKAEKLANETASGSLRDPDAIK